MRRLRALFGGLVALSVGLGLSVGVVGVTANSAAAAKQKAGGTVTYLMSSDATTLDAAFTSPSQVLGGPQLFAIYDALVIENDRTLEVDMHTADSLTSTDATNWTLKIHPGIKFSDGTPYNAQAVKAHFDRVLDPNTKSPSLNLAKEITTVSLVDDLTLKFTLSVPDATFPHLVARTSLAYVPSPTALASMGAAAFGSAPVGAGPYTIKEWVRSDHVTLVKNPTYWSKSYLDQVIIKFATDETQKVSTIQTGGADMMISTDPNTAGKLEQAKLVVEHRAVGGGQGINLNVNVAPFNDPRARHVLQLSFDQHDMNVALYNGVKEDAYSMFTPESAITPVPFPKANPKKAQALFDALAAEGKPVNFTLTVPQGIYDLQAQWLQTKLAQYKNVKMTLDIRPAIDAATFARSGAAGFQAGMFGIQFIDPDSAMPVSFTAQGFGLSNYGRYSNPQMDALLIKAKSTVDPAARNKIYKDVQNLLIEDMPMVLFGRIEFWVGHTKAIQGYDSYLGGIPRWDLISKKGT